MKIDSMYYDAGPGAVQADVCPGNLPVAGLRLQFEYDAKGRLSRMQYATPGNDAGASNVVVEYQWAGNLPFRIIRTDARIPGQEFILELTYGLKPVRFDHWALLSRLQLTNANTELWNLPLLASIDRLPLSVRFTRKYHERVCETSLLLFRQETDACNRLTALTIGQSDRITFTYP
ncbi:hypothetical protein [Chitinophaga deserti]|uniref:hypothetical protein n=1 Tax=Chitinophaga deserti TaxID=2164099 RepID=UPI000D6B5626|nr:hypothetical protein [Chitinophaga deserti]